MDCQGRAMTRPDTPETYILQLFSSQAARRGNVVRRSRRDVDRMVGLPLLLAEVERRGFRAVENADQVIIFCNREPVRALRPFDTLAQASEKLGRY